MYFRARATISFVLDFTAQLPRASTKTEPVWITLEKLGRSQPVYVYLIIEQSTDPATTKNEWGAAIASIPNVFLVATPSKASHIMRISYSENLERNLVWDSYAERRTVQTLISLEDAGTSLIIHQSKDTDIQERYEGVVKRIYWLIE